MNDRVIFNSILQDPLIAVLPSPAHIRTLRRQRAYKATYMLRKALHKVLTRYLGLL